MSNQLLQIKWVRVIVTALVVYIVSFLAVTLIVTIYATALAFQSRGAPDQTLISAFASQYAPWIGPVCLILFTIFGAMHVARRVDSAAVQAHGITLGVIASIVNLIVTGISSFNLGLLLTTILTIGAGWFGSKLVHK